MTEHTRDFARLRMAIVVAASTIAGLLTSTAAFAQANDADLRPTINHESIRRAIAPIDPRQSVATNPQSDTDWRAVAGVKAGADTRVVLEDKRVYRGRLQSADDRSVTLEIDGGNRTLQRADVRQVDVGGGGSARVRKARIMGAVGMFSGLAIGFASCRGKEGECIQGPPLTGMMYGWITGTIVGAALPSWRPIYAVR